MTDTTTPLVAYHDGGLLFAGIDKDYQAGWYLFNRDGTEPVPVIVLAPFSNDRLEPVQ
jgi:hypothetical protein